MLTIENQQLKVTIVSAGAELQSIYHKNFQLEYLWSGNPAFWAKRSPILFPIVGTLKQDTYFYKNKSYCLGRHGFAREMEFSVDSQEPYSIIFSLKSSEITLKKFPFKFEFRIGYQLLDDKLTTTYTVLNKGKEDMYFSVGAHPAFKVPLVENSSYNDYFLEFNKKENLSRWPISKDGLIETKPVSILNNQRVLPLTKELFLQDALVFKHLESSSVSLKSSKTVHGLDFSLGGFPYLGIWAAKNADFVCIEPWCGIADSVNSDQQLVHKEGINKITADEIFERSWEARFY
ncbi:MAG TPA: aldose 1-epimerase family protein [Puia sp.]|nr:aldose 1-epimerase family protein [Puia sp.]